jgi:RNA polymerase sigma-70 factor (ECF subfamily)
LIAEAGRGNDAGGRDALGVLLRRYQPALEAHLVQKRIDPQRVADLVQGFISDKIVEQNLLSRADREKGKFRTFLLTALQNYVVDQVRQENSRKRSPTGGAPLSLEVAAEAAGEPLATDVFDVAWAREVLAEAVRRMKAECDASRRQDVWGVFEERILRPSIEGVEPIAYELLVSRFKFKSPVQAANVLITGKRMFVRVLRQVVGEYARDGQEIEQEIADLRQILQAGA